MSFNDLNQYSSSHKVWDHVGNILPDIELSEGQRPAVEFKPASWLPVQFRDKYYEEWYVVMPGKAVALDPDGCVMPAQYGVAGLSTADVVYTQNDIDAGVIDISTGLAVTTVKTVDLVHLTGVRHATWTRANAGVGGVTSGFMGRFGAPGNYADATLKPAIGVAPYGYFQWAGGDGSNPANLRKHNHMLQHQVAVLCDYVVKLPYIPAQAAREAVEKNVAAADLDIGVPETHTRAQVVANVAGRYNATTGTVPVLSTYPVVAFALDHFPVATNTARTTIVLDSDNTADDLSSLLVNEKTALSAVKAAGDFFVDSPAGVVFFYSADGATLPTALSGAAGNVRITYYQYEEAAGVLSRFASVIGIGLQPGDFVKVGQNSNLTLATTVLTGSATTGDEFNVILGQVLAIVDDYDEALAKVRTAFSPAIGTDSSGSMANATAGSASANLGQLDQMPGSATGGYSDLTAYAGAVKYAIINLIGR